MVRDDSAERVGRAETQRKERGSALGCALRIMRRSMCRSYKSMRCQSLAGDEKAPRIRRGFRRNECHIPNS